MTYGFMERRAATQWWRHCEERLYFRHCEERHYFRHCEERHYFRHCEERSDAAIHAFCSAATAATPLRTAPSSVAG